MENNQLLEKMQLQLIDLNKKLDFFIEIYNKQISPNRELQVTSIEDFNPLKEE